MDWVQLHLMVNHFPIILGIAGAFAAVAAALARRDELWRFASVMVLLAGLTAPLAYVTGLQAEEGVEHAWYAEEDQVEEHEELGLLALLGMLAAGAAGAVALWRPGALARGAFLALTLGAVGVTAYTALEGGEIVHDSPALTREPEAGGGP